MEQEQKITPAAEKETVKIDPKEIEKIREIKETAVKTEQIITK